ncbi:hypothetical protein DL764_003705 [Monosporascus ibericus]|uniref:Amidohydrolase-related domain-containing protein n=1 Tax=Monosporascus ibericus TaxID=155417 RepID=A0A4Q4THA9_9PEZI|nr:hypothetical protein DL764_003705 [Monosporascus ibericus]
MVKRTVEPRPQRPGSPEPLPESVFSTAFGITIRTGPEERNANDARDEEPVFTIITANLLIPGDGEPLKDAALVIEDRVIAWVGPQPAVPPKYSDVPHRCYSVPYLMPGLWDCHVHFGGESTVEPSPIPFIGGHPAISGARLAKGCWTALQRGYTSLRDVAGYGCELGRAIDDGTIAGPNVYSCGACLSQTGGHGDIFELPAGDVLLHNGVASVAPGHQYGAGKIVMVDGLDECRRAVRLQVRRGARCIKVLASGGVKSRDDDLFTPQFSPEELRCVVSEAARQSLVVAAHVHSKPAIINAVLAGVRTIEHASFADQECVDLIKEKGSVYIATRTIVDMLLETGGKGLSRQTWEKAKLIGRHHEAAYKLAVRSGVTFALGTDTQPGFNMAKELEHAVKAGMSNLEAIKAATANGPLSIGEQAPKSGQLKAGYEADVLGLLGNPVEDVTVLQKMENVKWVWKGGKIFKGPGVGPWGEDD